MITKSPSRPPGRRAPARGALEVGERVFLRQPVATDCEAWIELRRISGRFLTRWEPAPPDVPPREGPEAFQRLLDGARGDTARTLCVCLLETREVVGFISLYAIVRHALQSCVLGYWIGKPYAGKGYMTEAVGLTLRYAFTTLRLHRIEANIMSTNAASIALVRKCGFRMEGVSKRYFRIGGRFRDHERWSITVEDLPRARRGRPLARPR